MLPKRYDARFFLADAARLISLERQPDCGELDEIAWFGLEEALALDLPTVTRFVLKRGAKAAGRSHPARALAAVRARQAAAGASLTGLRCGKRSWN